MGVTGAILLASISGGECLEPDRDLPPATDSVVVRQQESANAAFEDAMQSGLRALDDGDVAAAVDAYQQAISLQPRQPLAHAQLGNALLLQGNVAAAVISLQQAVALSPQFFMAQSALGNSLLRLQRYEEALAAFSAAGALRPLDSNLLQAHALALAGSRRRQEALSAATADSITSEPLGHDSITVDDWLKLGRALAADNAMLSVYRAIDAFERGLVSQPDHPQIRLELIVAYRRLGLFRQALDVARGFEPSGDAGMRLNWERSKILTKLGRYPEARQALETAIDAGAGADAYYELGVLTLTNGDAAAAESSFATASALQSNFLEPRLQQANLLIERGQLATARDALQRILELAPQNPVAVNLLGLVIYRLGDPDTARPLFEQALALDPSHANAALNLADSLGDLGQTEQAQTMMQRFEELKENQMELDMQARFKDFVATSNVHGLYYLARDQQELAIEKFKKALLISPDEDLIYLNLSQAHIAMGDHGEAAAAIEKAIEINPRRPDSYLALAAEYRALNREADAARIEARYRQLRRQ